VYIITSQMTGQYTPEASTMKKRIRTYAKSPPKVPKLVSARKDRDGVSLRMIEQADGRLLVVRRMRERVARLLDEFQADTLAKEALAGRAAFILQSLESRELDAFDGNEISWREYTSLVKTLTSVLKELGADKDAQQSGQRLQQYIIDMEPKRKKAK
jgi:hypothetical protein